MTLSSCLLPHDTHSPPPHDTAYRLLMTQGSPYASPPREGIRISPQGV